MSIARNGAPKVVLDTNVLISATFWTGASLQVVELVRKEKIRLVVSREIITEYRRTLQLPELIEKQQQHALHPQGTVRYILRKALLVRPLPVRNTPKDPDDAHLLGCARSARARYLITNDKVLLRIRNYEGTRILTPEEFLRES